MPQTILPAKEVSAETIRQLASRRKALLASHWSLTHRQITEAFGDCAKSRRFLSELLILCKATSLPFSDVLPSIAHFAKDRLDNPRARVSGQDQFRPDDLKRAREAIIAHPASDTIQVQVLNLSYASISRRKLTSTNQSSLCIVRYQPPGSKQSRDLDRKVIDSPSRKFPSSKDKAVKLRCLFYLMSPIV